MTERRLAVTAYHLVGGSLVLQGWIFEGSTVGLGAGQTILFEINSINQVVPEGGVTTFGRVLVI